MPVRRRGVAPDMGLTFGAGPLAAHPPEEVNYRLQGPAHKLLQHPFPRRVRAEFAGRTVLDSRRAVLLHETGLPPRLYVPEQDIDQSAFVPSAHRTSCPFKGEAGYRTLRVGDREVPDALWAYPEPIAAARWLAGYASLYWAAADAWYDEEERIDGLTDPFHRVDIRTGAQHVQVLSGDTVLAETKAPLVLSETGLPNRYYLTPEEVRVDLRPSDTLTRCPYKGEASYWSVQLPDGPELVDVAWSYPTPLPESARVAGRLSFLGEGVRLLVDGRPE